MKTTAKILTFFAAILLVISMFISCTGVQAAGTKSSPAALKIHFIDVGQADCILIQTPAHKTMLIDAGNGDDRDTILGYLRTLKVKTIDVLVATHPHEDHIGSMASILDTYPVGKIYMPKVSAGTKTFEDLLLAIRKKSLKITTAAAGVRIEADPALQIKMLSPNSLKYDDLNNYSPVIKIIYGNTSFLLTGDAETVSEKEILSRKYDLKADVLKVGHHGSSSSTSAAFLKAVSPKSAVISVGKGNDYGHPAQSTLTRLTSAGVKIYRTDRDGTIVASSDGKTVTFNIKASAVKPQAPPDSGGNPVVYITKTGEKYHTAGCSYLARSKIPISLKDAKAQGYTPCSRCNPPR